MAKVKAPFKVGDRVLIVANRAPTWHMEEAVVLEIQEAEADVPGFGGWKRGDPLYRLDVDGTRGLLGPNYVHPLAPPTAEGSWEELKDIWQPPTS